MGFWSRRLRSAASGRPPFAKAAPDAVTGTFPTSLPLHYIGSMPSDRLTVRFAYQRGWQVVDGSTILETFETKEGAFQFLVDHSARVWLSWSRTVIGGQTAPFDFCGERAIRSALWHTEPVKRNMRGT